MLALVLAETAVGGSLFLWLAPLWGRVREGFFTLTAAILAALALAAGGAAASGRVAGASPAPQLLMLALGVLLALSAIANLARQRTIARVLGLLSAGVGVAGLGMLVPLSDASTALAAFQLAAGAAFMGAVMDGLLLGHWYLVDRRLSRDPINLFAVALLVSVAVETVAVALQGFGAVESSGSFSSLLGAAGVASYLAIGMVLATALVAVMIRLTLRGERASAVQAATGFFYLAVIFAVAGEFAAKIRFLPPR